MRGKAQPVGHPVDQGRITPACAGKSSGRQRLCKQRPDHPRVCGEKAWVNRPSSAWVGSPPRVRGKALGAGCGAYNDGITPACAGKSRCRPRCCVPCWDHPRVCGEKTDALGKVFNKRGSPPRVRGKGLSSRHPPSHKRITPACAGKSGLPSGRIGIYQDHPRVCGEKSYKPM